MKSNIYIIVFLLFVIGCSKKEDSSNTNPVNLAVILTDSITAITQTTAICGGNVTSDAGSTVTARGVCWSKDADPLISGTHTSDGSGAGSFKSQLVGLTANTSYYVRAYATNGSGTSYGNAFNITTFADITTQPASNITKTTALCGGTITSDTGPPVISRGICWGRNHNPTIFGSYTPNGKGVGTFTVYIDNLTFNTKYYVRAYASDGTYIAYGNEQEFITLQDSVILTTSIISNITGTTAVGGGTITYSPENLIFRKGICWSTSHNPKTSDHATYCGNGPSPFSSKMTGLTLGTTYYVRSFAESSANTFYGNELDFTTSVTYGIGDSCGGGIIFYVDGTGQHGKIAATGVQESGRWGCYGTDIQTDGTGKTNTDTIIKYCNDPGIAARICYDLVLNGYSDWYLPSLDEQNQILLHKDILGGTGPYWTSSSGNQFDAWMVFFDTGKQVLQIKLVIGAVWPVRTY